MKYVVVFGTLTLALLFNATQVESWPFKALLFSGFFCFGGVTLAYSGVGPKVFLKTSTGRLTLLSWLIYWPYHALNLITLTLFRRNAIKTGELFSEIDTDLWLVACLSESEVRYWGVQNFAVLDVAGELSENASFRSARQYLSLPTLDRSAPDLASLELGAEWIENQLKNGPVYVHCALGHGRSTTFVAAYLNRAGKASGVEDSLSIIQSRRPSIDLSPSQKQALQQLFPS